MVRLFKEYTLITTEEQNANKIKQQTAIEHVRNTAAYISEVEDLIKQKANALRERIEWDKYLRCDPYPAGYETQKIRNYLFKTLYFEKEDMDATINWILGVDERSILNQDIDRKDLTRNHLKANKPDFGVQYDKRVNDAMEILQRINTFFENPTRELALRVWNDLELARFETYNQIRQYINNLTYRILCSEEAFMNEINPTTAEYSYTGERFDVHLWTFKNVPVYLDPVATPFQKVSLNQIKVDVVLPFSVLCNNLVLRGLHCHFDHSSAHVRFYKLPLMEKLRTNLEEVLEIEWKMQEKIQADAKAFLKTQREEFEISRIKAEEEAEMKAKLRKSKAEKTGGAVEPKESKPGKEPKRQPKEPQIITPGFFAYIRPDFLLQEEELFKIAMERADPRTFNLMPGEINLRKYQILDGTYRLNFLEKPYTTNLTNLIMTWYTIGKTVTHKTVKADIDDRTDETKFFEITFTLPECHCYWGEPVACLYEEGISSEFQAADITHLIASSLKIKTPVIINDFNIHELFNRSRMYHFVEHVIPRLISSFKLPTDIHGEDTAPKGRGVGHSKLSAKQQLKEKNLLMQKKMLQFEAQNSPERLFPLFKNVLPVVIVPNEMNQTNVNELNTKTHPYEYFSDFYTAVYNIKEKYRTTTFVDDNGDPVQITANEYQWNVPERDHALVPEPSLKKLLVRSSSHATTSAGDISKKPVNSMSSSVHMSVKRKTRSSSKVKEEPVNSIPAVDEFVTKWSTTNILKSEYKADEQKLTIWTDRLGTFALAYYRYQHFPFQKWYIGPNGENSDEVLFLVESKYAAFRFYISPAGYRVVVSDFTKYEKSRKVYFQIDKPIIHLKLLKEQMQQKFLNIFPEIDFAFYLTGYFSEKHLPVEYHTYKCITLYSTTMKFSYSVWNRVADRRSMIVKFGEKRDTEEDLLQIRITPENVTFVDITETCTALDQTVLEYTPTWRNLEPYYDLNHLITMNITGADYMRVKNTNLIYFLNNLLQAVRPFSCS